MKINWKSELSKIIVLTALYVLLGNARSIQSNPFIDDPNAVIAVYMIVPVITGILFGRYHGAAVGFLGTLINAFTPAGSGFEFAAILPHTIMGFAAGYLTKRFPSPIASLSLLIGHALNILFFILFQLIPFNVLQNIDFWKALLAESFFGIITIIVIVGIFRFGFQDLKNGINN